MTPELADIAYAAPAVCVLLGYYIGRFAGRKEGEKRGIRIGGDGGRVLADMVARRWANRREWPLDNRANVQRWKELGRREAVASCANELCRAFNIPTPKRDVHSGLCGD